MKEGRKYHALLSGHLIDTGLQLTVGPLLVNPEVLLQVAVEPAQLREGQLVELQHTLTNINP